MNSIFNIDKKKKKSNNNKPRIHEEIKTQYLHIDLTIYDSYHFKICSTHSVQL